MKRSQMVLKLVVGLMGIFPELVFAQMAPAQFNFDGTLLDSSGVPITSASVVLKLEIWDKAGTCALYSEQQSVDLSSTAGAFSVKIGAGTGPLNHLEGSALFDGKLFLNSGATGSFSGCPGGVTLAPGDARALRVSYNLGAGFVLLTPDFQMTSTPYTLIADTLQGKVPSDLILVHSDASNALTQVNAEYVFSSTKYPLLKALVDGTSTQYMPASPVAPVNFGAQRLSNVADPVSAQDAVSKNYDDGNLGGKTLDVTGVSAGVGGGRTLAWDQVANKWVTNASTGTVTNVNTGTGLLGGPISSSGTISVDVGTTALKILQLNASAQLPAVDGSLLINLNSTKLQSRSVAATTPSAGQVLTWNSTSSFWEPQPTQVNVNTLLRNGNSFAAPLAMGTTDGFGLTLMTNNSARLAIDPAGNVGIGTTSPGSLLSLQIPTSSTKGIVVKSAVGQSVNLEEWQDSAASPLAFVDQSGRITSAGFKASGSGTASLPVLSYNGSSAGLFFPTALTVALSTNGAERLRVDSTGNVGIGITTPAATLDVAGNVKLGLAGTPFTASGICTAGSTVYTIGSPVLFTCTGVPASTSVAVNCSPTTALAGYVTARATGTLNQIAITTGIGGTFTMTCMWMAP